MKGSGSVSKIKTEKFKSFDYARRLPTKISFLMIRTSKMKSGARGEVKFQWGHSNLLTARGADVS